MLVVDAVVLGELSVGILGYPAGRKRAALERWFESVVQAVECLPWDAGVAVAFGLPEEEALKAVTINAAEFMGVADKVGSLEVGKEATLIITTGTPLDMTSNIIQSYIQGREIDMNDMQKQFFKKYLEKINQQKKKIAS